MFLSMAGFQIAYYCCVHLFVAVPGQGRCGGKGGILVEEVVSAQAELLVVGF